MPWPHLFFAGCQVQNYNFDNFFDHTLYTPMTIPMASPYASYDPAEPDSQYFTCSTYDHRNNILEKFTVNTSYLNLLICEFDMLLFVVRCS